MSDLNPELLQCYVDEGNEHLDTIERVLSEWTQPTLATEEGNLVFRGIHSIKGAGAYFGLDTVGHFTHVLEELLSLRMKQGGLILEEKDLLLEAVDFLRELFSDLSTSNSKHREDLVQKVLDATNSDLDSVKDSAEAEKCEAGISVDPASFEGELEKIESAYKEGMNGFIITMPQDGDLALIFEQAESVGEVLYPAEIPEDQEIFLLLLTALEEELVALALQVEPSLVQAVQYSDFLPADETASEVEQSPVQTETIHESFVPVKSEQKIIGEEEQHSAAGSTEEKEEETVRVRAGQLDKMVDIIGELLLSRKQISSLAEESSTDLGALLSQNKKLGMTISALQEQVLTMRMQPLTQSFQSYSRMVRELARKLGHGVELHMDGLDVRLDRGILEIILEPVQEILFNACKHGSRGNQSLNLYISASDHNGQLRLVIRDDGKGFQRKEILDFASQCSLFEGDRSEVDQEKLIALVLHPDFVKGESPDSFGLRGVQRQVEEIGGLFQLETSPAGTIITLEVPLTLSILSCLHVISNGSSYLIPQMSVGELISVDSQDRKNHISSVQGCDVLKVRGGLLPLVSLSKELYDKDQKQDGDVEVLVIHISDSEFGLVVDSIVGMEDVVSKGIPTFLSHLSIYNGLCILGDGKIVPVVDVRTLIPHRSLESNANKSKEQIKEVFGSVNLEPDFFLFETQTGSLYCLPLERVQRVEAPAPERILKAGLKSYLQMDQRILDIQPLQDIFPEIESKSSGSENREEETQFLILESPYDSVCFPMRRIVESGKLGIKREEREKDLPTGIKDRFLLHDNLCHELHLESLFDRLGGSQ